LRPTSELSAPEAPAPEPIAPLPPASPTPPPAAPAPAPRAARAWPRRIADAVILAIPVFLLVFGVMKTKPLLPAGFDAAMELVRRGYQNGDLVLSAGLPPQDVVRALAGLAVVPLTPQRPRPARAGPPFSRVWMIDGRTERTGPAEPSLPKESGAHDVGALRVSIHPLPLPAAPPAAGVAPTPAPTPFKKSKLLGNPPLKERLRLRPELQKRMRRPPLPVPAPAPTPKATP